MKLWEGLEQDLNYNAMVSQRGVLNLYHSDAQREAGTYDPRTTPAAPHDNRYGEKHAKGKNSKYSTHSLPSRASFISRSISMCCSFDSVAALSSLGARSFHLKLRHEGS